MKVYFDKAFTKIAVLGSGTMGGQIAAHFANLGFDTLMFDTSEEALSKSLAMMKKLKPTPFASPSVSASIKTATYDNLDALSSCDFIIESIVENLDIKKQLFKKISPHVNDNAVLVTNTSGLSIQQIAETSPESLRSRIFGVHFFNPPRYMPLVELIRTSYSDESLLNKAEGFITSALGKEVVYAKDSPAFVANRIGVFSFMAVLKHAENFNLPADTVDALTGKRIGRPVSATFRTLDVVGLDVMANVVKNIYENAKDDPWIELFKIPDWIESLIEKGSLGSKTRKGIYEKIGKDIRVFDPNDGEYRLSDKTISSKVKKILKDCGSIENALLELSKSDDPQAQFLWSVHRDVFHYTAFHLEHIAETARCVDLALKSGFAWQKGIFEQVQITGWSQVRELLNKDLKEGKTLSSQALPAWVMDQPFVYSDEGAFDPNKSQFIPRSSHPVYERHLNKALLNGEKQNQFDILIDGESTKLIDIGNGIASVSFKTKMNVLSSSVLTELPECLDYLENNGFHALVFRQEQEHFCAGANLYEVISAVKLGLLEKDPGIASKAKKKAFEVMHPELPKLGKLYSIKKTVRMLQDLLMRLKHGKILTIAAVDGLALGGGCELLLHCNKVVASMNSYIGLVEVGIGALPAGCGSKEMALRAYLNKESDDIFPLLSKHFEQIAMAKVSASALEAREMGYLTSEDVIIANPNELLYVAKHQALAMLESGFRPPLDDTFKVVGKAGHANIMAQVVNLFEGHFMSEHDKYCISSLAKVMTGSLVEENTVVNSKMILDLERKYFVELLGTQKTQDRIEYMLRNSKPLRN
ncbi:MAG: 3-hydroxyacyl-CoA dehydrogenase/enoyl-CoA hydratase family protein [Thiotrichales bacterium]|jgi:3-hydroxyacyl-CoA dehydrogenase|nr:3-hydroxyacyl-CoA dehydrogenase/enoyl-CoA hydratase family protein [Thiotrichales bacterium]MBT4653360.1 3-hydroxyacyl-CoA dehydrogenase/enoyl-CoA hydratase family protein [Thiotrichales bacterium]MBT6771799.1 3-hydroxyacyl-CoA dehydrogenase/enoyl-CoA hydratase family protein [Thiotrichales bacterium]MBT7439264.1 3-hydroxyacyl-CoA dehydrogenase/enoyl-CoA hydratase family protein [Thiotrichales bacterium]